MQALSAYLFGSSADVAKLPLAREFESAVMGDMSQRLQSVVAEHGAWLRSNCSRQVPGCRVQTAQPRPAFLV